MFSHSPVLYFNLKCQHYYQVLRDCKQEIFKRVACVLIYLWANWEISYFFSGWENPYTVDGPRSYCLQKILFSKWCLELWHCHVGGDVLWRETVLGNVQPGCKYMDRKHNACGWESPLLSSQLTGWAGLCSLPDMIYIFSRTLSVF